MMMLKTPSVSFRRGQRGATLVIGMIMLVLLTLFVIAAVNMSTINLRVMGNTQGRNEAIGAAQQAIEQVATTDFPKNPQPVTVTVDVTGDGTTDYTVNVAKPACLNAIPIKVTELDPTDLVNDGPCFGSISASTPGVVGSGGVGTGGNSYCSNTQWDLAANVVDNTGGNASVTVHQGVARRVATGETTC